MEISWFISLLTFTWNRGDDDYKVCEELKQQFPAAVLPPKFNTPIEAKSYFSSTKFFGIHTFSGIYSLLRKIGFKIPDSIIALEYIRCGDYLSNIYTPLRRYIQDFGIIGMTLIMFFIGFCYKKLILSNKEENSSSLLAIYTAQFLFSLFFMSIEERVFMDVILIRSVYIMVCIYFVYQWLVKKEFLWFEIKER